MLEQTLMEILCEKTKRVFDACAKSDGVTM